MNLPLPRRGMALTLLLAACATDDAVDVRSNSVWVGDAGSVGDAVDEAPDTGRLDGPSSVDRHAFQPIPAPTQSPPVPPGPHAACAGPEAIGATITICGTVLVDQDSTVLGSTAGPFVGTRSAVGARVVPAQLPIPLSERSIPPSAT